MLLSAFFHTFSKLSFQSLNIQISARVHNYAVHVSLFHELLAPIIDKHIDFRAHYILNLYFMKGQLSFISRAQFHILELAFTSRAQFHIQKPSIHDYLSYSCIDQSLQLFPIHFSQYIVIMLVWPNQQAYNCYLFLYWQTLQALQYHSLPSSSLSQQLDAVRRDLQRFHY